MSLRYGWCAWGAVAITATIFASLSGCGDSDTGTGGFASGSSGKGGGSGGGLFCDPGEQFKCNGDVSVSCENTKGGSHPTTDCKSKGMTCADGLGCVVCSPGSGTCSHNQAKACKSDGSGYISFTCDPVQGMTCTADKGCTGACSPGELGPSYVGCDYYSTVTLNPVWSGFHFAVAVANASTTPANVTITKGSTNVQSAKVPAGSLSVFKLPWVSALKGGDVDACQNPPDPGNTVLVKSGAYRIRSDVGVTVYQLSPLEYEIDPPPADCPVATACGGTDITCKSYSNDASLLLPATALTGNYDVLAWPSMGLRAGFIAVTATADGTTVKLEGKGQFAAGAGVDASGNGSVALDAGDVIELIADHSQPDGQYGADISGTRVRADKPVEITSGQSCANIPKASTGYCDHIEEVMFPDETLGTDYLVTVPDAVGGKSPQVISILASQSGTTVKFDPSSVHADATLDAGTPLVIDNVTKDVHVTASKAILVAQYMQGSSSVPSMQGDPSLSLAIPSQQFRNDYIFVASTTYDSNFVNIMAMGGASIVLDGKAIDASEFSPIGNSGYAVARHLLTPTNAHHITSATGFGIVVYGYGKDTSYMYPGGLDLKSIAPPPPK